MYSADEIRKLSVVQVRDTSLYMKNFPRPHGVNDTRMGTTDRRFNCSTCKNDMLLCVGHIGHIDLNYPVYHAGFMAIIVKTLRCVCVLCSALLLPEDDPKLLQVLGMDLEEKDRLNQISKISKCRTVCRVCGAPQPVYKKSGNDIVHSFPAKAAFQSDEEREYMCQPLQPCTVRDIFKYISSESCRVLGFSEGVRPECMVLTTLVVPPPIVRPSIMASDGSRIRGQDDITIKLQDIIKTNRMIQTCKNPRDLKAHREALQVHVSMYVYDSNKSHLVLSNKSTKNHRQLRLVYKRLKGKKGRIRGNCCGKRVDFSARSVVSPDPVMDIDRVGVPYFVALKLCRPIVVNRLNKAELTERVRRGSGRIDGAEAIRLPDGSVISLKLVEDTSRIELQPGWVVERYLQDGDPVVFNRQPSLHKPSMMGHKVELRKGLSFRLPLCCTKAYNADFDGDEMNLHVGTTAASCTEIEELLGVKNQIISPQNNKPIIGLVMNSIVGGYLMTQKDVFFTKGQVCQLLMCVKWPTKGLLPTPAVLKPVQLWTGRQIFSMIIPDICVRKRESQDESGEGVLIRHGHLHQGTLCKRTLGTTSGGLIHVIYNDVGDEETVRFISDAQRLTTEFLLLRGFSVGIRDCLLPEAAKRQVDTIMEGAMAKSDELYRCASSGLLDEQVVETYVTKSMQSLLTQCANVVKGNLPRGNSFMTMITSGSKGSAINATQVCATVGQQSIEGGRPKQGRNARTLSAFPSNDNACRAKGLVVNSYIDGLTAEEYFFHAQGGREGIVDTAVKTASTGYIQRRIMKAMESLKVAYDHSVRDARNCIVQFEYGGNALDTVKVERMAMPVLLWSDYKVGNFYACPEVVLALGGGPDALSAVQGEVDLILQGRDFVRRGRSRLCPRLLDTVFLSVNVPRLLSGCAPSGRQPGLAFVQSTLGRMYANIHSVFSRDTCMMQVTYLRSQLSLRHIFVEHRLSKADFERVCRVIERKVCGAHVQPGENVGAVGAQSVGEPTTQLTLNTFHYAGVSTKNVTLGVPRLKEAIDATRNIKTPNMVIRLQPDVRRSEMLSGRVARFLKRLCFSDVISRMSIVRADQVGDDALSHDERMAERMEACLEGDLPPGTELSMYVIRYELDKRFMVSHDIDVVDVANKLKDYFLDRAQVVHAEVNMRVWFVRIRIRDVQSLMSKLPSNVSKVESRHLEGVIMKEIHEHILDDLLVNGLPNLVKTVGVRDSRVVCDELGQLGELGECSLSEEWVVETNGTDLERVMCVPEVDFARTVSNDIHEVVEVLGIEAGVQVLFNEIKNVLSFDGTYVNDHHIQLLVDIMTQSGGLKAMTRHGITKHGGSPLMRASFEETIDVFFTAGIFGQRDRLKGVTENIILGQMVSSGTGLCDLISARTGRKVLSSVKSSLVVPEDGQEGHGAPHYGAGGGFGSGDGGSSSDGSSSDGEFVGRRKRKRCAEEEGVPPLDFCSIFGREPSSDGSDSGVRPLFVEDDNVYRSRSRSRDLSRGRAQRRRLQSHIKKQGVQRKYSPTSPTWVKKDKLLQPAFAQDILYEPTSPVFL